MSYLLYFSLPLQQGLGAVEAVADPSYEHLDQLLSLEKQLIQAIGDPEETPPFTQVKAHTSHTFHHPLST